jgi:hypothetical protein
LTTVVKNRLFRLDLNRPKKSKAASIKLTLAAVVLDAENYSRSCTSVLLHDGEQRDVNRFKGAAPRARRAGDDINSYVVVSVLHKTFSAGESIYEQIAPMVSTRFIADE